MKLFHVIASLALLLAAIPGAHAQGNPGVVSGVITDASTHAPLENVSVALRNTADQKVVTSMMTAKDGKFRLAGVPMGSYVVECQVLGHKSSRSAPFVLGEGHQRQDMGTLALEGSVVMLKEVEVQTERETFNPSLDRRRYNVDHDIAAQSSTAADLLAKVPSVQVDFDGGLTLRGSDDVTVLVDGRPSRLMGKNRKNVLLALPASNIEQIEVVTNPSARYVPDGSAGIINLITKKGNGQAFSTDVSGFYADQDRDNGNLNLNLSRGPVELSGGYRFRDDLRSRVVQDNRVLSPADPAATATFFANRLTLINSQLHAGNAAMTWHASPHDLLTMTGEYLHRQRDIDDRAAILQRDTNGNTLSDRDRTELGPEGELHRSASATYQHEFPGDHQVSFDLAWSKAPRQESAVFTDHFRTPIGPDVPNLINLFQQEELDVFTAEYKDQGAGPQKLDGGYMLTYHDQDITSGGNLKDAQGNWVPYAPQIYRFRLQQLTSALFTTYERNLGKFDVLAGVRGEFAAVRPQLKSQGEAFRDDDLGLFPTLSLRYTQNPLREWQFNYGRRIKRPSDTDLNPFVVTEDPLNLTAGDTHVKPEITNSFELGHMMRFKHATVLPTAFYRTRSRLITSVTEALNDSTTLTTVVNAAKDQSGGLESIVTVSLGKMVQGNFTGSVYYEQIDATNLGFAGKRSVISGTFSSNLSLSPWRRTTLELNPLWKSPKLTPNGTQRPNVVMNAGLKQGLWKNKLSGTVAVSDVFNTRRNDFTNDFDGIRQIIKNRRDHRLVYMGLTYHFGVAGKAKDKGIEFDNNDNN